MPDLTVPRAAVIEAVATIEAAANVVGFGYSESACERISIAASDLAEQLLGWRTSGEDDPIEVEIYARATELEADFLEDTHEASPLAHRIRTLRAMAPRYRERGTVDVMFQLAEPPLETSDAH